MTTSVRELTFNEWIPAYDTLGRWHPAGDYELRMEMLRHEDPPGSGECGWADFRIVVRSGDETAVIKEFAGVLIEDIEASFWLVRDALDVIAEDLE